MLTLVSVAPDGTALPSYEWNPRDWDFPPTCWTPGQTFVDTVTVRLARRRSRDWLFSLSILDAFSKEPMRVTLPDGTINTQVGSAPFRCHPLITRRFTRGAALPGSG